MSIPYEIDIYHCDEQDTARFTLGRNGRRNLLVIGLNPSKANEQKPDPTLRKVLGYAGRQGFDGFVMMNLYAGRHTYPSDLPQYPCPKLQAQNREAILKMIDEQPEIHILVCWGDNILIRPYLLHCFREIVDACTDKTIHWLQIGHLTKKGHPRHPARSAYDLGFRPFDVDSYLSGRTT